VSDAVRAVDAGLLDPALALAHDETLGRDPGVATLLLWRTRPAVGFGLDVKEVAELVPLPPARPAIRAPGWGDAALRATVRQLRANGDIVVRSLAGDRDDEAGFVFDRSVVRAPTGWAVQRRTDA